MNLNPNTVETILWIYEDWSTDSGEDPEELARAITKVFEAGMVKGYPGEMVGVPATGGTILRAQQEGWRLWREVNDE